MYRWCPSHDWKEVWLCCSVKEKVPDILVKHYFLHCHALVAKTLLPNLKDVLSIYVQVVNFICGCPLHHRLFKLFCEEMRIQHQVLLFHTEVRQLSHGKILTCMAELKNKIVIFLLEYQSNFVESLYSFSVLSCRYIQSFE